MRENRRVFLERYRRLGVELTGDERTRPSIRVNRLRSTPEEAQARLGARGFKLTRISWLREGFWVEGGPVSVGATFEHLLGVTTPQEAASQSAVETLTPCEGEAVLDLCAAPGGKTSQLSAWMRNTGVVVAVDRSRERLYALENTLERLGCANVLAYWGDAVEFDYGGRLFDRVLLDAPCSGNYATDPDWFDHRSLYDVQVNAANQKRLLEAALRVLRPGGVLLYATCSLEPEENELNVRWMLENHGVEVTPIKSPGVPALTGVFGEELPGEVAGCRRIWPGGGAQGFFLARMVKR